MADNPVQPPGGLPPGAAPVDVQQPGVQGKEAGKPFDIRKSGGASGGGNDERVPNNLGALMRSKDGAKFYQALVKSMAMKMMKQLRQDAAKRFKQ